MLSKKHILIPCSLFICLSSFNAFGMYSQFLDPIKSLPKRREKITAQAKQDRPKPDDNREKEEQEVRTVSFLDELPNKSLSEELRETMVQLREIIVQGHLKKKNEHEIEDEINQLLENNPDKEKIKAHINPTRFLQKKKKAQIKAQVEQEKKEQEKKEQEKVDRLHNEAIKALKKEIHKARSENKTANEINQIIEDFVQKLTYKKYSDPLLYDDSHYQKQQRNNILHLRKLVLIQIKENEEKEQEKESKKEELRNKQKESILLELDAILFTAETTGSLSTENSQTLLKMGKELQALERQIICYPQPIKQSTKRSNTLSIRELKNTIIENIKKLKDKENITEEDINAVTTLWNDLSLSHNSNWLEKLINWHGENWDNLERFKSRDLSPHIHPDKYSGDNRQEQFTKIFAALSTEPRENPLNEFVFPVKKACVDLTMIHSFDMLATTTNHFFPNLLKSKAHEKYIAQREENINIIKKQTKDNYNWCKTQFKSKQTNLNQKVQI